MGKLRKHFKEVVSKLWNASGRCKTDQDHFMNAALGLAAEAGEVADIHKKFFFHKVKEGYRDELILELGDVYFYLLKIQDLWDIPLEQILACNKKKLFERYNVTN